MKTLIQYVSPCSRAMYDFTINFDVIKLLTDLNKVEEHAKSKIGGKDCNIWFKFFKGDTGATTIKDIERTLLKEPKENKQYLIESFRLANKLENELQVYYS